MGFFEGSGLPRKKTKRPPSLGFARAVLERRGRNRSIHDANRRRHPPLRRLPTLGDRVRNCARPRHPHERIRITDRPVFRARNLGDATAHRDRAQ